MVFERVGPTVATQNCIDLVFDISVEFRNCLLPSTLCSGDVRTKNLLF